MTEAYSQTLTHQNRLVKVIQETPGSPGSFPNTPVRQVYKCMPAIISTYPKTEGALVSIVDSTDPDKAIYVANFRNNIPVLGNYYLVTQISPGIYVFDNQMAFLENQ